MRNEGSYMPDVWEMEYSLRGYLSSLSKEELFTRHNSIIKNMGAHTSPDRHTIPIEAGFISSWYWYRKEHQTRCEMAKRGIKLPKFTGGLPLEQPTNHSIHIKPAYPNSCNVLYRYTEPEYAEKLLTRGSLYLKAASQMSLHNNKARYDIEISKSYELSQVTMSTENGQKIPIKGNVTCTSTCPDYYLYCLSTDYDPLLLEEFGGACIIIKKPIEFTERLTAWGSQNLPGWRFGEVCIKYFDPYDHGVNDPLDAGLFKSLDFAYQREYRLIFFHPDENEARALSPIEIGSIEDIAEIYIPDNSILKASFHQI